MWSLRRFRNEEISGRSATFSDPDIARKVGREVSCRITAFTVSVYQAQGVDMRPVFDYAGHTESEFMNLRRRLPWEAYIRLLEGICHECGGEENFATVSRVVFASITDAMARKDQRELNRLCPDRSSQKSLQLTQRLIYFSAMTLQSFAKIHALHMKATLAPVAVSYEQISGTELIITHTIREPYRRARPFFIAISEVLAQGPASLGVRKMRCEMKETDTGAEFRIRCSDWPTLLKRLWTRMSAFRENAAFLKDYERQIEGELTEAYQDYSQARVDLEKLLESTAAGVVVISRDTQKIVYANRMVSEAVTGDFHNLEQELLQRRAQKGALPMDFRLEGGKIFELVNRLPLNYRGETCLTFTVRDVTVERQLDHRIDKALEDERRRFAEDLHDDVGQRLTAARIRLDTMATLAGDHTSADDLRAVEKIIRGALEEARSLAKSLHPETAQKADFWVGLQEWVDQAREAGMQVAVRLPADKGFADEEPFRSKAGSLLRILGEMVGNALRHSGGNQLQIFLDVQGHNSRIKLGVLDDGVGFLSQNASPEGIGLRAMQRRIVQLHGVLTLEKGIDGQGAGVIVALPLREV